MLNHLLPCAGGTAIVDFLYSGFVCVSMGQNLFEPAVPLEVSWILSSSSRCIVGFSTNHALVSSGLG